MLKLQRGWHISNRPKKNVTCKEKDESTINRGIHVFLDRYDCEIASTIMSYCIIVPCKCYKRHLVSGGQFEGDNAAVYTRVKIAQKDIDNALAEINIAEMK